MANYVVFKPLNQYKAINTKDLPSSRVFSINEQIFLTGQQTGYWSGIRTADLNVNNNSGKDIMITNVALTMMSQPVPPATMYSTPNYMHLQLNDNTELGSVSCPIGCTTDGPIAGSTSISQSFPIPFVWRKNTVLKAICTIDANFISYCFSVSGYYVPNTNFK